MKLVDLSSFTDTICCNCNRPATIQCEILDDTPELYLTWCENCCRQAVFLFDTKRRQHIEKK